MNMKILLGAFMGLTVLLGGLVIAQSNVTIYGQTDVGVSCTKASECSPCKAPSQPACAPVRS